MAERKIESANPAPKQPQKPSIISYTKEQYYLLQPQRVMRLQMK